MQRPVNLTTTAFKKGTARRSHSSTIFNYATCHHLEPGGNSIAYDGLFTVGCSNQRIVDTVYVLQIADSRLWIEIHIHYFTTPATIPCKELDPSKKAHLHLSSISRSCAGIQAHLKLRDHGDQRSRSGYEFDGFLNRFPQKVRIEFCTIVS